MQVRRIVWARPCGLLALVLGSGCETAEDDEVKAAERCAAYVERDACASDPQLAYAWVEAQPVIDASTCNLGAPEGRCIVGDFYGEGCTDVDSGVHYRELGDEAVELTAVHGFCGHTPVSEDWRPCVELGDDPTVPDACGCIEAP